MSKLIPTYIEQSVRVEQLERELVAEKEWVRQSTNSNARLEKFLAEAQAEVVRLKGEAESWEKVFDRTCEHLADAKTNAERYRWLRDEAEWYSCHITNTVQFKTGANFLSLDAAIDAAMKEGK